MAVRSVELVRDTAGAGRWRGSPALRFAADIESPHVITLCTFTESPAAGGSTSNQTDASAFAVHLSDDAGHVLSVGAVEENRVVASARLTVEFRGGAGYGDPFVRPVESVVQDIRDDLVSKEAAKEVYGVEVDAELIRQLGGYEAASRRDVTIDLITAEIVRSYLETVSEEIIMDHGENVDQPEF